MNSEIINPIETIAFIFISNLKTTIKKKKDDTL